MNKLKVGVPSGAKLSIEVPENLDPDLIQIGIRAFLGGLSAISKGIQEEARRDFLIRYVAATCTVAAAAVRSTQLANRILSTDGSQQIIEDLLKSLHTEKRK